MYEARQLVLGEAHALGQDDTEAVEQSGLGGIWLGHAAQTNLAVRCGRQDDILGLDARQTVRGELPRPARCCHISRLFHSTKARKQTRI